MHNDSENLSITEGYGCCSNLCADCHLLLQNHNDETGGTIIKLFTSVAIQYLIFSAKLIVFYTLVKVWGA